MKTGARLVCLVTCALLLGAMLFSNLAQPGNVMPPETDSIFQVDVPAWYVGDSWTYDTHLHLAMGLNYTDFVGSTTFTVTELFNVRQNGTYYEAYNLSASGSFTGSGMAYVSGMQATITITSAGMTGYQWFDRSDLSLIRDNETISGQGTVQILFFTYPLQLRFDSTSNRSPSQEDFDFPLLAGDEWHFVGNMRSIGYYYYMVTGTPWGDIGGTLPYDHNTTMDFDARLQEIADIDVGGTMYHAYHINETAPSPSPRSGDSHLWYAPAVRNNVRQRLVALTEDYLMIGFTNLTSYTIKSPPFTHVMNLDPQVINPGGYLNVTGTTAPSADVTVRTPWNESSMNAVADSWGNYSFRIRAPDRDDNTPCNTDVGSFGVLVEATAGISTSYNASSIVLVIPDLYISRSDLGFSSPPTIGVPTTILATVHESTDVGVYSPVAAEFLLNGGFLASDSVMFIPAGEQHTFTTQWTPTSGIFSIGVRVDPSDAILEKNESNNYAEIGAAIEAPDLVPWNITIHDGILAQYQDPGAVGFVSPFFNASLGEHLNISFDFKNVGNLTFVGDVRVIAVETQGFRGPPLWPPLLDRTLNVSLPPQASAVVGAAAWPVPATMGSYFVNLTVDPENKILESFEGNNTFFLRISVGAPDLMVTVGGPTKVPVGSTDSATIVVTNRGNRPSNITSTEIRNATSGSLLATLQTAQLNASGSGAYYYNLGSHTSAPGNVCLQFSVDPNNVVSESDESNNVQTWCFEVTALPETWLMLEGPEYRTTSYLYITSSTNITFSVHDYSDTGIASTMYRVDTSPWAVYMAGTQVHIEDEGLHVLQFNSTDNVGGAEPTNSSTIWVDNTAPKSTAIWDGTAISLSAIDNASGVASVFYRLDSGNLTRYVGSVAVSAIGVHTVQFYAVDNVQNAENLQTYVFEVSSGKAAGGENLKPYVAAIFAIVLLIAFLVLRRKDRRRDLLFVTAAFIVAEILTGVASLSIDPLSLAPSEGRTQALYIDLVILVVGLVMLWVTHRLRASEVKEEQSEEKP